MNEGSKMTGGGCPWGNGCAKDANTSSLPGTSVSPSRVLNRDAHKQAVLHGFYGDLDQINALRQSQTVIDIRASIAAKVRRNMQSRPAALKSSQALSGLSRALQEFFFLSGGMGELGLKVQ
jgi:hypothetical protein